MIYLLDTHTFLWFITDDGLLSNDAKRHIEEPQNTIYLSVASIWEIAIKSSLGKLQLPHGAGFIEEQCRINRIDLLHIQFAHVNGVATLPFHHRDPFDRLIIAQSLSEDMPIIGKDAIFDAYSVKRYW